jgi:hypothetical protein
VLGLWFWHASIVANRPCHDLGNYTPGVTLKINDIDVGLLVIAFCVHAGRYPRFVGTVFKV